MVMQIQVQISRYKRVFLVNPPGSVEDFKKTTFHVRFLRHVLWILVYFTKTINSDKGEYVVLNDVRMADIRLASFVYLLVYVSMYCVPIALLRQNKPFSLLYLGHAQIKKLQRLSSILSEDHKWSIFDLFRYEASEPTLVAVAAKPEVEILWNLDLTKSSI